MTYVMKMPGSYVDVSKEEMKYDGGFAWIPFCAGLSAGLALGSLAVMAYQSIAKANGWICLSDQNANTVYKILGTGSAVCGCLAGYGFFMNFQDGYALASLVDAACGVFVPAALNATGC